MPKNVGAVDRIIRIILGLGLLSLAFVWPQTPWGYIGLVLIVTGFVSFCPLYRLVGLSSCKKSC